MYSPVVIASPFRGVNQLEHLDNLQYLDACIADVISRGQSPYAPHFILPQFLSDDSPNERSLGIDMGKEWIRIAHCLAVYTDRGISSGMQEEVAFANVVRTAVEYRTLGDNWLNLSLSRKLPLGIRRYGRVR